MSQNILSKDLNRSYVLKLYHSWKYKEHILSFFGSINGKLNQYDKEQPIKEKKYLTLNIKNLKNSLKDGYQKLEKETRHEKIRLVVGHFLC